MSVPKQLLENCRWLFNQEVKIITFKRGTQDQWHAIVVPKECSLMSLKKGDINKKILFKASSGSLTRGFQLLVANLEHSNYYCDSSEGVIQSLHQEIGTKIGEILHADSEGLLQIEESAIPECTMPDAIPIPVESIKSSTIASSTQTTPIREENPEMEERTQPTEEALEESKDKIQKQTVVRPESESSSRAYPEERGSNESNTDGSVKTLDPILSDQKSPSNDHVDSFQGQRDQLLKNTSKTNDWLGDFESPSPCKRQPPGERQSPFSLLLQQPIVENSPEDITFASESSIILGAGTTSKSDPRNDTAPILDHSNVTGASQRMVKDEIKLAMRGLLKCLAEHVDGIS